MASPYQPLADFLSHQPPETTTVTLTLPEIEQLLGVSLPEAAWARDWWRNDPAHRAQGIWLAAGWRVTRMTMRIVPPTVMFSRRAVDRTHMPFAPPRRPPAASA